MDWSELFNFLGAGGGLVVLLKWLTELPFVRLRLKGEREEAFRDMLDKDSELIGKLHGDILLLQEQVSAQAQCLERLVLCPSYSRCPARNVVQDYKSKFYHARTGQPQLGQKGKRMPRDNPTQPGGTPDPGGQPP